jgi:hypothetical protein
MYMSEVPFTDRNSDAGLDWIVDVVGIEVVVKMEEDDGFPVVSVVPGVSGA